MELHWFPPTAQWVLYRRAIDKPAPADEMLIHVTTFPPGEEPGSSVIDWLNSRDVTKRFGGTPEEAAERQMNDLDYYEFEMERRAERKLSARAQYAATEAGMAARGRDSAPNSDPITVSTKPGRKLIYGPENPEKRH